MYFKRITYLAFLLILVSAIAGRAGNGKTESTKKVSKLGEYHGFSEASYKGYAYTSFYLEMRDGVKLAVDLFLPKKLEDDKQIPTVLYLTRYVRTLKAKWPFNWLKNPIFGQISESEVKFFTSYGYAVVLVDVRATGASFGTRSMEFSPEEVKDGGEIVDWIIAQDWSNKRVGSTGVSYLGTTAEMLLVNQHPAVKACIPRSNIFDLYNDIVFPGGVAHTRFVEVWRKTTYALDNNELGYISKQAGRLVKSPHPVDGDRRGKSYQAAMKEHDGNFDFFEGMMDIQFRDERHPLIDRQMDDFSIHQYQHKIEDSGTPIYRISGWYDGGLANSAIKGYLATKNSQKLLIGPWDHGPVQHISPFRSNNEMNFDVKAEMLRFFDFHLKDIKNGILEEPPIHYYRMGEEKFEGVEEWPVPDAVNIPFDLTSDFELSRTEPVRTGIVSYRMVDTLGTGGGARWNSLTTKYRYTDEIEYPERSTINKQMLCFTSQPFSEDMEVTGHPVVLLNMSVSGEDATVFAYLESVDPNGKVTYITEGQLRTIHRKVSNETPPYPMYGPYHTFKQKDAQLMVPGEMAELGFELLPVSHKIEKGHAIRLSIAGYDVDHFEPLKGSSDQLTISCSSDLPSRVIIPLVTLK